MPSVSEAQRRAMAAAAAGKSKIGIPKDVGKEYMKADHAEKGSRTRSTMRARTAARWRAQGVSPEDIARRLAARDARRKG